MARKKMPIEEKKTHITTVRMNEFEYEMVCGRAKDVGLSISNYIRHQAVFGKVENHFQVVADFPQLEVITRELSRIGNNLNQLTQYFHMGGLISTSMQELLRDCINDVMDMRKEVMKLGGDYHGYSKTHRK